MRLTCLDWSVLGLNAGGENWEGGSKLKEGGGMIMSGELLKSIGGGGGGNSSTGDNGSGLNAVGEVTDLVGFFMTAGGGGF